MKIEIPQRKRCYLARARKRHKVVKIKFPFLSISDFDAFPSESKLRRHTCCNPRMGAASGFVVRERVRAMLSWAELEG